jgi:hypothetical protein
MTTTDILELHLPRIPGGIWILPVHGELVLINDRGDSLPLRPDTRIVYGSPREVKPLA